MQQWLSGRAAFMPKLKQFHKRQRPQRPQPTESRRPLVSESNIWRRWSSALTLNARRCGRVMKPKCDALTLVMRPKCDALTLNARRRGRVMKPKCDALTLNARRRGRVMKPKCDALTLNARSCGRVMKPKCDALILYARRCGIAQTDSQRRFKTKERLSTIFVLEVCVRNYADCFSVII